MMTTETRRGGYANRQVVILMIQACPPPKPACFDLDKDWRDWLILAHQTGLRVVRIAEVRSDKGYRTTQRRLLDTPQIPYCTDCDAGHKKNMIDLGRCIPSKATTPTSKEHDMIDITSIPSELEQAKAALALAIEQRDAAEGALRWSVVSRAAPDTSELDAIAPGWARIISSTDFKAWLLQQPADYQQLITSTADQSVVAAAISTFAAMPAPAIEPISDKEQSLLGEMDCLLTELEQTKASLAAAIAERDAAERALAHAYVESEQQQQGALLYLAAVVGRAVAHGTTLTMSRDDMEEAMSLVLERGDTPDGGLALRVRKVSPPVAPEPSLILPLAPVLAKVNREIVLLDTSRPAGE